MALTAVQQQTRKGRITSTTMPAILGVHPWKSELQAWMEITGVPGANQPQWGAMNFGTVLERWLADEYRRKNVKHPRRLLRQVATLVSPRMPWLAASPDGVIVDGVMPDAEDGTNGGTRAPTAQDVRIAFAEGGEGPMLLSIAGGLETKTSGWIGSNAHSIAYWIEQWEAGVPDLYRCQADVCMLVTGAPWWDIVAMVPGLGQFERRIERDEAHLANLAAIGQAWHDRHVVGNVAPEATERDHELLGRVYRDESEEIIDADEAQQKLAEEYAHAWGVAKAAEREKDRLGAQVKAVMGEKSVLRGEGFRLTWREQQGRSYIDADKLEELHPGVVAQVTKRSAPFRVLRNSGDLFGGAK